VNDVATVTDAEARQLAGRTALYRVVRDGDPVRAYVALLKVQITPGRLE
jgi:hypothetical protein